MGLSPDSVAARWGCKLISQKQYIAGTGKEGEEGGLVAVQTEEEIFFKPELSQQHKTGLSSVIGLLRMQLQWF